MKLKSDLEKQYNFVHTFFVTSPEFECRMLKETAKEWLLKNGNVTVRGHVRYLQIKDMGLGVCVARLRAVGFQNTFLVKQWEK